MTPYDALCRAIRARGGACTPSEVGKELAAYLAQFKVVPKTPEGRVIDWNDIYTREQWHALVNSRKRKSSRITIDGKTKWELKQESKGVRHKVKGAPAQQQPLGDWAPNEEDLDRKQLRFLGLTAEEIDAFAKRPDKQLLEEYHAEF